jgi:quinol monooxygenase YgiN
MLRTTQGMFACLVLACVSASVTWAAEVKLSNGTVLADKPYFIVSYIEVAPDAAGKAAALIKKQVADGKKQKGNLRFESVQRVGRANHFVIIETWADPASREAHAKADHTIGFRKALQPHLYSPYDERPHVGLVAADPKMVSAGNKSTVYVITHVDIIPPEQFPPCKRQVSEAGPCGNAMVEKLAAESRKHAGMVRFDVLTQANRPNHMKIVEMWDSAKAQQQHTVSPAVKHFRDTLSGIAPGSGVNPNPLFVLNPLTGSLYDERIYKGL